MKLSRVLSYINIDRGVGKEIEEKISNAKKRVIILSPWISSQYVGILSNKSKELEHLKVMTYESEENYRSFKEVITKEIELKEFLLNGILALLSFSLFLYLVFYFLQTSAFIFLILSFLVFVAFLLFFINLKESYTIKAPLDVIIQSKKDKHFLHVKAYLIDDDFYLSSANFTESGFKYNIESMVKVEDKIVIEEFLRYVEHLEKRIHRIPLDEFIKKYSLKERLWGFFK